MTDEEIRDSLKLIYEESIRTWSGLQARKKRIIGGDRERANQVKRAWNLQKKALELYLDYLNESDIAP